MPNPISPFGRLQLGALALLSITVACGRSDQTSPSTDGGIPIGDSPAPAPIDSTPIVIDSPLVDTTALTPNPALTTSGIPFGPNNMRATSMTSMYNATQLGVEPPYFLSELRTARGKGGRFVQKMAGKRDEDIQNADGTFSLAKWKLLVNRYKGLDFSSYVNDGTLMGHFLIDEPEFAKRWGGKAISQATVEEMARYSKQLWPNLLTFARGSPQWLAKSTITYNYLDVSWLQDFTFNRDVPAWVAAGAAAAKLKGLGMIAGIHVINGGNGSSGVPGTVSGKWNMSAAEIRTHGTTILNEPRACAFLLYTYLEGGGAYMARPDIRSAITELWNKAKAHPPTSCRQ
jgi:hypothetical protein